MQIVEKYDKNKARNKTETKIKAVYVPIINKTYMSIIDIMSF
jgi:hypothetical protein